MLNAGLNLEIANAEDSVNSAGMGAPAVDKGTLMVKDAQAKMAALIITVVSKTL